MGILLLLMCEVHYTIASIWIQDVPTRSPNTLVAFVEEGVVSGCEDLRLQKQAMKRLSDSTMVQIIVLSM